MEDAKTGHVQGVQTSSSSSQTYLEAEIFKTFILSMTLYQFIVERMINEFASSRMKHTRRSRVCFIPEARTRYGSKQMSLRVLYF